MFDVFKKQDEEQNNMEQESKETNENLTVEEETQTKKTDIQEPFEHAEAELLATLEELGGEERVLIAEKTQLLDMEETLRQKILDEINVKRHSIENLKYEIPELKERCENLAKALDIPVQK